MKRVFTVDDTQYELIRIALNLLHSKSQDWLNQADDPESLAHYEDLIAGVSQLRNALDKQAGTGEQELKGGTIYLARAAQVLDKYLAYPLASKIVKEMAMDHDEEDA